MRRTNVKLRYVCLILVLFVGACGKRSGIRNTQPNGTGVNDALNRAPEATYNRDNSTRPISPITPAQPSVPTDTRTDGCTTCGSPGCQKCSETTEGETAEGTGMVLGTVEDDMNRLPDICKKGDATADNDFDFDGRTNACEEATHTNSLCYNGALVAGVELDKKVLKSLTDRWFPLKRIFAGTDRWIDLIIEELAKKNKSDVMEIVNQMYTAHRSASGTSKQQGSGKNKNSHPFRVEVADDFKLETILLNRNKLSDDAKPSTAKASDFEAAIVKGGRAYPLFTDPVSKGQGKVTGLKTTARVLAGEGAMLYLTEFFLTLPGTYEFFTGVVLANNKDVQYSKGRGNFHIVSIGGNTELVSSVDLPSKGKASQNDLSDHITHTTYTVTDHSSAPLVQMASIIRKAKTKKGDRSFINDQLFVKYTNTDGVSDKRGAMDVATFVRQDYIQVSMGRNRGMASNAVLQKALYKSLDRLNDSGNTLYGKQIKKVFYEGCKESPNQVYPSVKKAEEELARRDQRQKDAEDRLLAAEIAKQEKIDAVALKLSIDPAAALDPVTEEPYRKAAEASNARDVTKAEESMADLEGMGVLLEE